MNKMNKIEKIGVCLVALGSVSVLAAIGYFIATYPLPVLARIGWGSFLLILVGFAVGIVGVFWESKNRK